MRAPRRDALRFALVALPLLAVSLTFYGVGIGLWEAAVVRAANLVLAVHPRPYLLEIEPGGALAMYALVEDGARKFTTPLPHGVFLSLALVPTLLLATPAPVRDRCRWIAIAFPVLFVMQVAAILALYAAHLALRRTPERLGYEVLFALATRSGQLLAVALWAIFTWRFWFRGVAGPDRRARRSA